MHYMVRYFIGNILSNEGWKPENDPTFDFTKEESKDLNLKGVPVRMEHHDEMVVGNIIRGWDGKNGSKWVLGKLNGDNYQSRFAQFAVDKNKTTGQPYYSGLSLQHTHTQYASGKSKKKAIEISLCCEPRRPDTKIAFVDSDSEPNNNEIKKMYYKTHTASNQMDSSVTQPITETQASPEPDTISSNTTEEAPNEESSDMSREDMMKVIIQQQKELENKKTGDDTERNELLELKRMMEKQKADELKKTTEKSSAMMEALVNDWENQVDKDQMTDSQKLSMRNLVKQFPTESMELLRVAHCASKHAKQQAVKFAEFKSLTEKTVLATRFDEVMKNKRPIQPPMQPPTPVQQVVHAASNKRQKMMSDTEHFVKAMSKYNVSGSARDKMDSIASFSARKPMENRSYF